MKDISINLTNISFTTYGNCRHKIKSLSKQNTTQYFFVIKVVFKLRKAESALCSFCKAEDETYIDLFYRCRKTSILCRQHHEFFITALDLPSILPPSNIFSFLDDALEHTLLLNHILVIFKNQKLQKLQKTKTLISTYLKHTAKYLKHISTTYLSYKNQRS